MPNNYRLKKPFNYFSADKYCWKCRSTVCHETTNCWLKRSATLCRQTTVGWTTSCHQTTSRSESWATSCLHKADIQLSNRFKKAVQIVRLFCMYHVLLLCECMLCNKPTNVPFNLHTNSNQKYCWFVATGNHREPQSSSPPPNPQSHLVFLRVPKQSA